MFRKHFIALSSIAATGVLLLSGCHGDDDSSKAATVPSHPPAKSSPLSFTSGTALDNNAPANTGDFALNAKPSAVASTPVIRKWVQLSAGKAGDLNPVVVNGAGFTLYRFDKDTANPSESNCTGECATTWPPYTVSKSGRVFIDGVDKSTVGFLPRDGGFQVTIGGQPVYLFSRDIKPGDTNGQGVDHAWAGITPTGQQAVDDITPEIIIGGTDAGAKKVTFFSGENYASPAQEITEKGCKQVHYTGSLHVRGSIKIWNGEKCTGKSLTVDSDVSDLSTIGFPRVKSVELLK
ncbi:hypothetical protein [Streptomyces sp. NPDC048489]|uniref:hypothetical protein n=1 Tax=Streptomyces sp. NPDC048489 TaxID=3154504 RepID=UPI00342F1650